MSPADGPRLLMINHYPVLPARNGGQLTVLGMSVQMAHGWPVELLWTERRTERSEPMAFGGTQLRVSIVPNLWSQRHVMRFLRHWLGGIEGDLGSMLFSAHNRRLVQTLVEHSRDGDIFFLAHPWLWPALRAALKQRRACVVYDAHNVEYVLKQAVLKPGRLSRWMLERVQALEAEVVRAADLVLACTDLDARQLVALSGVPREKILLGTRALVRPVAAERAAAARLAGKAGRTAIFVGSNHPPNNETARWIAEELGPRCPQWQFRVVGYCCHHAGEKSRSANVAFVGPVESLADELAAADVALNPIIAGSGINMKVIEYLQFGLPVLSTAFGARGFDHLPDNGLLVCEREQVAAALQRLIDDPGLHARLVRQAIDTAPVFGWPSVGERVRGAIAQVLGSRAQARANSRSL
jgi:glycosyltransferase involved in cell wall biosynthesis